MRQRTFEQRGLPLQEDDDDEPSDRLDRRRPLSGTQTNPTGAATTFSLARNRGILVDPRPLTVKTRHTRLAYRNIVDVSGDARSAHSCVSLSLSRSLAHFSPAQRPIRSLTLAEVGRDASANHAPASRKCEKVIKKKKRSMLLSRARGHKHSLKSLRRVSFDRSALTTNAPTFLSNQLIEIHVT